MNSDRWKKFLEATVEMMPTWSLEKTSYEVDTLPVGLDEFTVYSLHPVTDRAKNILKTAGSLIQADYRRYRSENEELLGQMVTDPLLGIQLKGDDDNDSVLPNALELESLARDVAIEWLENFGKGIVWRELLNYLDTLRYRTYENEPVTTTIVIDPEEGSKGDWVITKGSFQKLLDMAAVSQDTYLHVNRYLDFLGYREANITPLPQKPVCAPSFATNIWGAVEERCFIIQKTRRGDVLISRPTDGLIASWRKGFWYLYERGGLQGTFIKVFGKSGSLILDLVLDLSYRRHGALLVYDPKKYLKAKHFSNKESKIRGPHWKRKSAHAMLGSSLRKVSITSGNRSEQSRRLIAEVASMDGAVIFDDKGIRRFGAMLVTKEGIGDKGGGARTTAMHSARRYRTLPVKVSADGDVTLFYPGDEGDIMVKFA